MLQAAELRPLVVTGIALDKVTVAHPTPEYPRVALQLGVDGNVQVTVRVQNGKIVDASASADGPDNRARFQRMDRSVLEV
jgi:hypothetical protein